MAIFGFGVFNTTAGVCGYAIPSSGDQPSKPLDLTIEGGPVDTIPEPVFDWLTSLDVETQGLTYEMAVYDSATSALVGSAMVSGMDLPASYYSSFVASGITSSYTISMLYYLSAFVTHSWLERLNAGSFFMRVRAYNGVNFGDWSDDLFFNVAESLDAAIVTLIPKHSKIDILWINPPEPEFVRTVIAFSTVGYPGLTPSEIIVDDYDTPDTHRSFIHSNLTNGQPYYYTAYSYDSEGHVVLVNKAATPIPATSVKNLRSHGRDDAILLVWDNPTYDEFPNFNGVIVRGSTEGFPATSTDGRLVYQGKDSFCYDRGLSNGVEYYYSVWTIDSYNEAIEPVVEVMDMPIPSMAPLVNITINNGATVTYTNYVEILITPINNNDDTIDSIMISNYADFRDASWGSYALSGLGVGDGLSSWQPMTRKIEWALLFQEGIRYVYVMVKDIYGNISEPFSSFIEFKMDWIDLVVNAKAAIKGTSNVSRYGAGVVLTSTESVALYADGNVGDLLLYDRTIKTGVGNGILVVDGKNFLKYKVYAP